MLPDNYHEGDEKWLKEQIDKLISSMGINHARITVQRYSEAYTEEYNRTAEGHKKENNARRYANGRLVKLIKSLGAKPVKPLARQ